MKANQQFVPNKKLVLHFDVEGILRLSARKNKDLYVTPMLFRYMVSALSGSGAS